MSLLCSEDSAEDVIIDKLIIHIVWHKMHVKWGIVMQIIVDRIHVSVWISSRHIVIIACIAGGIATAVSSCSHCVDEQKQSCWKKISKIVTDF